MNKQVFSMDFYGKNLSVEVGELAKQANGAVLVRYNDIQLFINCCGRKGLKKMLTFSIDSNLRKIIFSWRFQ